MNALKEQVEMSVAFYHVLELLYDRVQLMHLLVLAFDMFVDFLEIILLRSVIAYFTASDVTASMQHG